MTANPAGLVELTGAGTRVHGDGLADDEAIADELADGLAGVGVGDLVHLIGVEPNLALAAADHGGGEALLGAKVDPGGLERRGQPLHTTFIDCPSVHRPGIVETGGNHHKTRVRAGTRKEQDSHLDVGVWSLADEVLVALDGKSRR